MATLEWWWRSHASFSLSLDEGTEQGNVRSPNYFSPNATILTRLWNCNPRWQLLLCLTISYVVGQLIVWPDFQHDLLEAPPEEWGCNCSTADDNVTITCREVEFVNISAPTSLLGRVDLACPWDVRRCELGRRAGSIVGALLLTMIADRRGRKVTTLFFAAVATGLALSLVLTGSRDRYFVVNIFFGLFRQVPALTGLVWAIEFIPPTRRATFAIAMLSGAALHRLFIGLLALSVRWEALAYTAVFSPVPGILLLFLLANESLGFLIAKNKYKSVKKIIRQRADRVNRTRFPLAEVESLQRRADATAHYLDDEEELSGGPPYLSALGKQYNLYDLVHSPRLLSWTLISLCLWSLAALLDYVSRAAVPAELQDAVLLYLLRGGAQLGACLLGALCTFAVGGRSKLLLTCDLLILLPLTLGLSWTPVLGSARSSLSLFAVALLTFAKATLVLLCVEVYPTSMRCLGLGLNFAAGQLVSLLCFAFALPVHLPAVVAVAVSVPCLVLFLRFFPDTRAVPLPESLYEIEQWPMPVRSALCRCFVKLLQIRAPFLSDGDTAAGAQ